MVSFNPTSIIPRLSPTARGAPLELARTLHAQDLRKGPVREPYLHHLLRVALLARDLAEEQTPPHLDDLPQQYGDTPQERFLAAIEITALLHDAHEDHPEAFTLETMARQFPPSITSALRRLSKPQTTQRPTGWYLRYLMALREDPLGRLVKLADLRDNLRDARPGSLRDKYEISEYLLKLPNPLPHPSRISL